MDLLKNKKVLILGLGREGRSSYRLIRRFWPQKRIGLADQSEQSQLDNDLRQALKGDQNVDLFLGRDYLESVRDHEVVFKTPGLPFAEPNIEKALAEGVIFTSQTELFLKKAAARTIGVTGTKGKSTTAALIHNLLKERGAFLIGNMGRPALDYWDQAGQKDSLFVYEMSSHQLDRLAVSPGTAVFLNLMPDHLDHFPDKESYYSAKSNIMRHQGPEDLLIYNARDQKVSALARSSLARKLCFGDDGSEENSLCRWQEKDLLVRDSLKEEFGFLLNESDLAKMHPLTRMNLEPAVTVAKALGVSDQEIMKGLAEFSPPAHRLEFVGRYRGIDFYNDSAATIPEATMAAVDNFPGRIGTLMLGGSEKGTDYSALAESIARSGIKELLIFPVTGPIIAEEVKKAAIRLGCPIPVMKSAESMEEAVRYAYQRTPAGQTCLLSPASASFSMFKDYQERGDVFRYWVKEIAEQ